MKKDYQLLSSLKIHSAFKALMLLWLDDVTEIEAKRDSCAGRGQESAWRYWAGQEKGYKRAMTRLDEGLARMDQEGGEVMEEPSEIIEKLLNESRGEKK